VISAASGRLLGLAALGLMASATATSKPASEPASAAVATPAPAPASVTAGGVEVGLLARNKKVIPLRYQLGSFYVSNVKLPDLIVTNHGNAPINVGDVDIAGLAQGKSLVSYHIDATRMTELMNASRDRLVTKGAATQPSIGAWLGELDLVGRSMSATDTIAHGESAVVPLSKALFVDYVGGGWLDQLQIRVGLRDRRDVVQFEVPLLQYQVQGKYRFPLSGKLFVANMPGNLTQHRGGFSQEFSLDVVMAEQIGNFITPQKELPASLPAYPTYRRDVLAVGDGVVAEVGDRFPEEVMDSPAEYAARYGKAHYKLEKQIGTKNTLFGNYVVIDHENGEFSLCAHLSAGSIRVKQGDRVKRGQRVAKVGTTGLSSEPHLHFQLMDGPDYLTANSLPVMFVDIPAKYMNQNIWWSNSLFASDYFYVDLK